MLPKQFPQAVDTKIVTSSEQHRLASVIKLREQIEDRARLELANAQRQTAAAEESLREAEERSRRDHRGRGSAADWQIAESAHGTALREVREAERAAQAAVIELARTRTEYVSARGRAEAVRRISAIRAETAAKEREAREDKELDELAVLGFARAMRG